MTGMIFPLFKLAFILALQGSDPAQAADRLAKAELEHDRPTVIQLLTQYTDSVPTASLASLSSAIPSLVRAAADPDPHVRSLGLLALTSLTNRARPDGSLSNDALPLLEPFLPVLSQHLADPDPAVRQLTALFLGGFLVNPTPAVILPLLSTLASVERPTAFDLSVVVALLTVGVESPHHPEVAPAVLTFLHRPDLTGSLRVRMVGAIANHPRHNATLDAGLLTFLDPTQPTDLRVSVIDVLPRLALSQTAFEATRARLREMVANASEEAAILAAAGEVLPCWTSPRMSDPCPAPAVHYRMMPQPAKPVVTPQRYESPLP